VLPFTLQRPCYTPYTAQCLLHKVQIYLLTYFSAVNIHIMAFWVVTPCYLVGGYRCFRGNAQTPSVEIWEEQVHPKHWHLSTRVHSITSSQKSNHNKLYDVACDYQHLEQHTACTFRLEVNMEAVYLSKTSVPTDHIAYCCNLRDCNIKSSLLLSNPQMS
jgi:hypothetical protein